MGDTPFGFGLPDDPDREPGGTGGTGGSGGPGGPGGTPGTPGMPGEGSPVDPAALFGDPQRFADALRQFADLMSWQGGPVNWDLAKNVARQAVAAEGDPSILARQRTEVSEAVRLADLWLDDVTAFPSGVRTTQAWSRSEWVEATLPVWSRLCDPIAAKAVETMSGALTMGGESFGGGDLPQELRAQLQAVTGPMSGILRQVGGLVVGGQIGQAVGALALEVVSSTDVGLPLGPEGTAALLPQGVATFGSGLSVPAEEVQLFVALREAAHHRLFGHVPWLRGHLFGAVEEYARGINVDTARLNEALSEVDVANPQALQEALAGGTFFRPEETPRQKAALARLETALALVEGWVSTVVADAAGPRMPSADALAEAFRRRRATGGPAERTFAALVGLELRPRRLREAAAIWRGLTAARGVDGRDAVWAHPDLLPDASDFDDPDSFVHKQPELDISDLDRPAQPGGEGGESAGEGNDAGDGPHGEGDEPGESGPAGESGDPGGGPRGGE